MKHSHPLRTFTRKYTRPWWRDHQWKVIGGIALLALVLGYVGFSKHFAALGENRSPWDIFYLTIQLLVLESGSVSGLVSWELELARLLLPAIATYAAVKALIVIFWEQLQLLRVSFIKDHVVICGLGRKGMLLAQKFREQGYHVVMIELDKGNDMIDQCKDKGTIVLLGDARDQKQLRKARVHKAKYLISVCGNDGVNAEVVVNSHELVKDRASKALTCAVHIVDPQLCHLLREQEIGTGKANAFRLEFFNIFDSGARSWLKEYPPFSETEDIHSSPPHLLVVGVGLLGESLVVHAAKKWKFLPSRTSQRLRITIIDKVAEKKKESLYSRYPQLEKVCDLVPRQMDIEASNFQRADFLFDNHKRCDVTSVFVCLDNDSFGLSAALTLHQHIREYKIPIVVKMTYDTGLATLLHGKNESDDSFVGLHAFGLLERTCQPDLLLGGTHEILARAIHEDYVRVQKEEGQTPQTKPYMVPWDELPEYVRESNRLQADSIGLKLKAIGCCLVPLADWDAELFKFTPEEVEIIAEMEHERWMSERRGAGWTYSPGPKNIKKKTTPYLVPWDALSEDIKNLDRNTVRALPSFLLKADFQIYRLKKVT